MTSRRARLQVAGFTLVEALVATALMGLVLTALATITSQWLPNWNRVLARVQQNELLDIGLQRIAADLAASEFVPPNAKTMHPLFEGSTSTVVFVRTSIGPNAGHGLDIIRIADGTDERGAALIRSRTPFVPAMPETSSTTQLSAADSVVLVRFPYQVSFSYAGRDRIWKDTWHDATSLPSAVRISVRDAVTHRLLPASTAVLLHIETSAQCDCADAPSNATTAADPNARYNATPNDNSARLR